MQYYPFISNQTMYKSVYGAVASNQSLTLRLLLHFDAHCSDAYLLLRRDDEPYEQQIQLSPKEALENYRFYDCDIKLDEGLYWYRFKYNSDYGEFFVTKVNNLGIVSADGSPWQLTVYSSDYKTPDWIKGGIIYQIFPDRFLNSGKSKKDVPNDRYIVDDWQKIPEHRQNNGACSLGNDYYGGDLAGITKKLGYLKALGVNCIYLNPIFEAHSNHRYNTANYFKIDASLGSEADFKQLCKKAKALGIHIILDGVFSHTGDDSIYFNAKRRYKDNGAYNSQSSPYYNWYKFKNWPEQYFAWWDVPSLPEIDENNAEFTEFITGENGVLRHWLRLGADGWRLDVADELPDEFLDKTRNAIKQEKPDAFLLGEVWEDATNKISYNTRRRYLRGAQLDSVMNYPFANAITDFVLKGNSTAFLNTVNDICENYPAESLNTLMNHIGTHDTMRILTRLGSENDFVGDRNWQSEQKLSADEYDKGILRLRLAAVLQFTLPGVPSIYYGDETGIEGYGDPFCRSTINWKNPNKALQEFYKTLGSFRRKNKVFIDGNFVPIYSDYNTLTFMRQSGSNAVFVAVNVGKEAITLTLPENFTAQGSPFEYDLNGNTATLKENTFLIISGKINK